MFTLIIFSQILFVKFFLTKFSCYKLFASKINLGTKHIWETIISFDQKFFGLREGFKNKKNVKFGLLAEIRRGRGLREVHEPNLLSGIFFIV